MLAKTHGIKALLGREALFVYAITFATCSLFAQTHPTLSAFLLSNFAVTAFELGIFFVGLAVSAIVVSQWLAGLSDKFGWKRPNLAGLGMLAGAAAFIGFAYSPNYWSALAICLVFYSLSAVTLPQLLAHGREFAERTVADRQVPLFNSILRSSIALAWVAGPPLGFYLQHALGGRNHYLVIAVAYALMGLLAWRLLPGIERPKTAGEVRIRYPRDIKLGFAAFTIIFGVNQAYLIGLPPFLVSHLKVDTVYAGYLMGTAAALEVPIMILGGWLATRVSILPLLKAGVLAAVLLYCGVFWAGELWQLFALQIFNAIFVGLTAGLGMTWFQDQLPNHTGSASTLFVNAMNVGNVLGGVLLAVFASWLGYRTLYLVNAVVMSLALLVLWQCRYRGERAHTALAVEPAAEPKTDGAQAH